MVESGNRKELADEELVYEILYISKIYLLVNVSCLS